MDSRKPDFTGSNFVLYDCEALCINCSVCRLFVCVSSNLMHSVQPLLLDGKYCCSPLRHAVAFVTLCHPLMKKAVTGLDNGDNFFLFFL